MKVVGFVGSPRKNGNTDILVQQVLDGAVEAGVEVEKFYINEMNFKGCQDCGYCRAKKRCKIDDDMAKAYDAIKDADGIVFGSPIYYFQLTGQMRLFLDRFYAFMNPDFTSRIESGKKAVIVGSQGAPDATAFTKVYEELSSVLQQFFGIDVKDTLVGVGYLAPGEVKENIELMERAKNAGMNIFE